MLSIPSASNAAAASVLITILCISGSERSVSRIQRNRGLPQKSRKFFPLIRSLCPFIGSNATQRSAARLLIVAFKGAFFDSRPLQQLEFSRVIKLHDQLVR